jgi:hypothetical protein
MENNSLTNMGRKVIDFFLYLGYTFKDKTVIGELFFMNATNTISDIQKVLNKKDKFICLHPLGGRKLKANIVRVFTLFADFDFKDYQRALDHIPTIKAILDSLGIYYGIVHSGRGLHVYIPVGDVGKNEIMMLNMHLNKIIFSEFYVDRIIDRRLIRNFSTFVRIPETVNSRNGRKAFIAFHNFHLAAGQSINYTAHNYQIMLSSIAEHESKPVRSDYHYDQVVNIDYRFGFFKWKFFDFIINGTADVDMMSEIIDVFKGHEDRELNNCFFPNLAVYIKRCSSTEAETDRSTENAVRFIRNISADHDDPANLRRWLNLYDERFGSDEELKFKSKGLLNWAARQFPGTVVHKLIKDDSDRLYRHRAYFSFITENMNGNSVEEMRAQWNEFVEKNIDKPGFHWGVLETGIGKTERFLRLLEEGKRVVFLVPFIMLKFDIERDAGRGSVFTIDSIRGGDKAHTMRGDLIFQLINADLVAVDEAHCQDLHYTLKPQIMNELNDTLRRVAKEKPVFMLTGTPSVNQILTISDPNTSKIVSYLRKDLKRISITVIDKEGLENVLRDHDRILIFIDDKRQIDVLKGFIETHLKPEHTIFPIHSAIKPILKKRTEEEIQETEKWVIIGTSSVVSGINLVGLQTIVFSNRIMNQQNLYQCMGRLRVVNRLDTVQPVYIMNMADFKNPRAELDMFEFVSPGAIITYLAKLYHITQIISCESKICSFTRLSNFEDWKSVIRTASGIREYYALPQVQAKNLYWIPMDIIRQLNDEGFFKEHPKWFNVSVRSILYMKNGEAADHRAIIEVRNRDMGITNSPIRHYFDPEELYLVINKLEDTGSHIKRLPKAVKDILETKKA